MSLTQISSQKSFGGYQNVYSHNSKSTDCKMKFAVYLPASIEKEKAPVLYWLSGLTCTHENFMQKSGFQRYADQHGIVVVLPDTSPRGCGIAGEDDDWDFGSGAGFYVNAVEEKWKKNYNMYSYVTQELPSLITSNFNVDSGRQSITGHSMGGHGALICTLKNPGMYRSVSAFAPICNPIECPWGRKAFTGYLGSHTATWKQYDATELVKSYNGPLLQVLIDQGTTDKFLIEKQLLPENFVEACRDSGVSVVLRMQDGYDHSYFFVSTFLEDHFKHHSQFLKK